MPPRVHPGTLRRARLLDALDGAREVPLTILNAGVGYGIGAPRSQLSVTLTRY
jgi:ATP/maltotriose-dependent transcriptional regulator MalT